MARRDDPNFAQVSGYIDKEVVIDFKLACTLLEISQTDALEDAIKLWLEKHEQERESKQKTKKNRSGNTQETAS
ncbi:MAG: hypothetical protein SVX43_10970 [Cyanobacteriota bacterium]|nr:hypothetical protein [Cyanobacteriota bacterium]